MNLSIAELFLIVTTFAGCLWRLSAVHAEINSKFNEYKQDTSREIANIGVTIERLAGQIQRMTDSDTSEIRHSEQQYHQLNLKVKELKFTVGNIRDFLIKTTEYKVRKNPYDG